MCRSRWLVSLMAAGIVLVTCGCPGHARKHTYPDDPLFISKKPQEMSPTQAIPLAVPPSDPQIPPVPLQVRLATKQ